MADQDKNTEEERELEETSDFPLIRADVKVPAPAARQIQKVVKELASPFWPGIKEVGWEAIGVVTERLRLSKEQIQAQRVALSTVLQKQNMVEEVTRVGIKMVEERSAASSSQLETAPTEDITTGWLRRFRQEVEGLGDEENMAKRAFTTVLAGEIERPGSFSIRALRVLGTLDQKTAEAFAMAASLALIDRIGGPIHSAILVSPFGLSLGESGLRESGLDYRTLNVLSEHGLLTGNYNENISFHKGYAILRCQGKDWLLSRGPSGPIGMLQLSGILFTTVGLELIRIVDVIERPQFIERLRDYLSIQSSPVSLTKVPAA